jgi:ssDNA-binding Zn-finger/Zn-ribbon topoisomerase 1
MKRRSNGNGGHFLRCERYPRCPGRWGFVPAATSPVHRPAAVDGRPGQAVVSAGSGDGGGVAAAVDRLAPACAICDAPMRLRESRAYPLPNGQPRLFWGCSRYPRCRGTHGAHPDGRPLGTPADEETKCARRAAHAALDQLWQHGPFTRRGAYAVVQRLMGMTKDQAHIGKFDRETCERLITRLHEAAPSLRLQMQEVVAP